MEKEERQILERIAQTLEKLPEKTIDRFLLMAEGAAFMAESEHYAEKEKQAEPVT